MDILMFGWEFPPHNSGGLGTACHGLTRALVSRDINVKFVLPRELEYADDWIEFVFAGRGKLHKKYINSLIGPYMTPSQYLRMRYQKGDQQYRESLIEEVYRYASLAGDIAQEMPHDLIHAHDWLTFLAGAEAKQTSKKPYVVHVHATEYDRSGGSVNPEVYEIEKKGIMDADHIIAVSQYTKNILTKKYGVKAHHVDVVHNGVHQPGDVHHQEVKENEILKLKKLGYHIVLYAGRLTLQKGPDYFVRAAKRVLEYHPKTIFVIAGSGDMEYELVDMVSQMDLANNVIFTGWLRGKELAQMFASADLFVLPSVSEPFGIVPLEAITYGTPVIVSRQSGVSEALNQCLKVDFWDVDDMAHKIINVLQYDVLREELEENSMKEVEKFSWDAAADKCINIYTDMIRSGKRSQAFAKNYI